MDYQTIQNKMQEILDDAVASGRETGISLGAYHKGSLIVNACAGIADTQTQEPVSERTLFPVFSATKGITATMLHILAERGAVDYEQRICEIWPGFEKNGKRDILIKHAMSHTAGIPYLPGDLTADALCDWDYMCKVIEDAKPAWEPGTHQEYHALTYGWIVGHIIELTSGKPFDEFFQREIRSALMIEDMYIGVPGGIIDTLPVAKIYETGSDIGTTDDSGLTAIPACCIPASAWVNKKQTLTACIPSGGGGAVMNALSLAKHYAALLPGGVDGVKLLTDATIEKATQVISSQEIEPGEPPSMFGLGYDLDYTHTPHTVFGHDGYGGSTAFADLEHDFAVALTKNKFSPDGAEGEIVLALKELLHIAW